MAPLIAKRTTNLLVLLLTVVTASADGDEINIRIIKKRHPYLDLIGVDQTPDQVPMLDWDATYRIILHDVDLRWIQSASSSTGRIYRQDSMLTIRLPYVQRRSLDSFTVTVALRASARVDSYTVSRRLYIRPNQKVYIPPPWQRRGLYLRWGARRVWFHPAVYYGSAIASWSMIKRQNLADIAGENISYQNYDNTDTSLAVFDSLYITIYNRHHTYRYHVAGSSLPAEAADVIRASRPSDSMRVIMYYLDKQSNQVRHKTLYISLHTGLIISGFYHWG
ncbi:MAG: hypothetical protein JSS76_16410 [Bacteroidetes bacterium]|nr:hypothetical protein [Bacteroidota bacterium]